MTDISPPGGVDDFALGTELLKARWAEFVTESLAQVRAGTPEGHSFFVPGEGEPVDVRELPIAWDAFPTSLGTWFGKGPEAEQRADAASEQQTRMVVGYYRTKSGFSPEIVKYRQQDEYCEWRTELEGGYVRRVTFTTEAPEYFAFLAREDPSLKLLAAVYSNLLGTTVMPSELMWPCDVLVPTVDDPSGWTVRYPAGSYNMFNDFNLRRGLVHCTHPDNTLMKAAMLVASASILRHEGDDEPIVDPERLICASAFGDPNRTSDPSIGAFINAQVIAQREVSVANPVGVYISALPEGGFTDVDGNPVEGLWTVTRGNHDAHQILRAVFEVPRGYDRILLDGVPVTSGAQLARRIRMTSSVLTRTRQGDAPRPQRAIARCIEHLYQPNYRGVFFADMDWQMPPDEPPQPGLMGASAPERVDAETLKALALGAALDGRWSRWSLFGRWS